METIRVSSFTKEAASSSKGEILKNYIEKCLKNNVEVAVDFSGITMFASPFFNSSFASLALTYGFDVISGIELINISDTGQDTFDSSMENARMLSENSSYTARINEIIVEAPKKTEG
ncbi:MAG: STAS-like domain-containing protein [Lachnospiraceae bacterium]|nr:STAS-like domain-containing protein [Lachnospiraceae bacterium]